MLDRNEMLYPVEVDDKKGSTQTFRLPAAYKTWAWKDHTYPDDPRNISRANFEWRIEEEDPEFKPWDMIEDEAERIVYKAYFLEAFGDIEAETWSARNSMNHWEQAYIKDASLFSMYGGNENYRGTWAPEPGEPHTGNFDADKADSSQDLYYTPSGKWKPEGDDELDGVELRREPEVIFEPCCRPIARRHGYADVCGERGTCNCAEAKEAFEASDYVGKK